MTGLCRSPLGRNTRALAIAVALVVAIEAWGVCHLFSGRGAFMVFGAALGTIMVANVLFIIIPGQRELDKGQKGKAASPTPVPACAASSGSVRHNTLFHATRAVRHDQQPLRHDLRGPLQLAGTHRDELRRRLHPGLVCGAP